MMATGSLPLTDHLGSRDSPFGYPTSSTVAGAGSFAFSPLQSYLNASTTAGTDFSGLTQHHHHHPSSDDHGSRPHTSGSATIPIFATGPGFVSSNHSPHDSFSSSIHSRNPSLTLSGGSGSSPSNNSGGSPPSSHNSPSDPHGAGSSPHRRKSGISAIRQARNDAAAGPYSRRGSSTDGDAAAAAATAANVGIWTELRGRPETMSGSSSHSGEEGASRPGTTSSSVLGCGAADVSAAGTNAWFGFSAAAPAQVDPFPYALNVGLPGMSTGTTMMPSLLPGGSGVGGMQSLDTTPLPLRHALPASAAGGQIMINSFASHRNYTPPSNALSGGFGKLTLLPMGATGGLAYGHQQHPQAHVGAPAKPQTREEALDTVANTVRNAVTTSAQDRARQVFVQTWLHHSYIAYADGNVSRQGLYGSYLSVCNQYGVKAINSASFGKAVRQAFPNIKTRRLGVRGNSKYHYCGMRPSSQEEADLLATLSRAEGIDVGKVESAGEADDDERPGASLGAELRRQNSAPQLSPSAATFADGPGADRPQTPTTARPSLKHNGSSATVNGVPAHAGRAGKRRHTMGGEHPAVVEQESPPQSNARIISFPNVEEALLAPGFEEANQPLARQMWAGYSEHCQALLETIRGLRFDQFEMNMRTFWMSLNPSERSIAEHPAISALIYRADAIVYDEILEFFHSQTLQPLAPQSFASLRQLADNMEQIIIISLAGFEQMFVRPKIELAARFGHLIVRHLGICQLAQALVGIVTNPATVKDMSDAWDGIDFEAVRNQAALVTNCHHELLTSCFQDFKKLLSFPGNQLPVEHLIAWADATFERCLHPAMDENRQGLSPRSLLVRWNFVASQLMRDLTLRSSPTFGNFQIVSLFFEDWLSFQVLRKVALQVGAINPSIELPGSNSHAASMPAPLSLTLHQHHMPAFSTPIQAGSGSAPELTLPVSSAEDFLAAPIFSPNTQAAFAQYAAVSQAENPFEGFTVPDLSSTNGAAFSPGNFIHSPMDIMSHLGEPNHKTSPGGDVDSKMEES